MRSGQGSVRLISTTHTPTNISSINTMLLTLTPHRERGLTERRQRRWRHFTKISPEQPVPLTRLVGEETSRLRTAPPSTEGFRWPLPWLTALVVSLTGPEGCWSEVLPEGTAWAGPRVPGGWESGSCWWPPCRVPEAAWAGRGSAGTSKNRCVLVSRPWRDSEACRVGTSISWLNPLVGTESTWALLNSDNTLEVFEQRNLCDRSSARMPKATGTMARTGNCCFVI